VIRVAVLTVSDGVAAGRREDTSGGAAAEWVERCGWSLLERAVVPDETGDIAARLTRWADSGELELILTLGGTGLGPRDVTPEATSSILERPAPGIAEALRAAGMRGTPYAMLSRGLAGVRGRTLIVNLPGSERAVGEGLEVLERVVPHAVDLLAGRTEHG
jgi:molybdenum cofactor synthesis domain-containing protein